MNCFATAKFVPGLTNARSSIILVQTIKKGAQMNAEKEKVLSRRVKKKKMRKEMKGLDRTRTEEGGASDEVRRKEHKG